MNETHNGAEEFTVLSEIASGEQTSGIEQVNLAVTEMDTVTQQNAQLVEEAAAAAAALQEQATHLTEVVSIFRLAANSGATPAAAAVQPMPALPVPALRRPAQRGSQGSAANAPHIKQVGNAGAAMDGDWEQF